MQIHHSHRLVVVAESKGARYLCIEIDAIYGILRHGIFHRSTAFKSEKSGFVAVNQIDNQHEQCHRDTGKQRTQAVVAEGIAYDFIDETGNNVANPFQKALLRTLQFLAVVESLIAPKLHQECGVASEGVCHCFLLEVRGK